MMSTHDKNKSRNTDAYLNELEQQNRILTALMNCSAVGMYVSDYHTGEVLFANPQLATLLSSLITQERTNGVKCWNMMGQLEECRCVFCPHERLIGADGKPTEPHTWERFIPDNNMWLKIISQAVVLPDGRLAQVNTLIDITDSKSKQDELTANARTKENHRMQQNLQTVLDVLPVPVRIIDIKTDVILYANNAALDLFGLKSPEAAVGIKYSSFMPEVQPDGIRTDDKANSLRDGEFNSAEFMCVKPDGERLELMITTCEIEYNGANASLGVMQDMSREKEHQRMQQSLQEVLDKLPIPIRITDQENARVVYANDACLKLFECKRIEDMLGRNVNDLTPVVQSDGTASKNKVTRLLHTKESYSMDIEYLSYSGKPIDTRITACVINYRGRRSTLGIITDLAAEKEQRRMLLSAAEKERDSNKLKSSFLSNMSHEVRTPMNAIIGLTEIELNKKHPKETLDVHRKINVSAKNLLQIANDILDLSKIEADKLELFKEEFELEEVLDSALLVISPRLEGKHVELMLDISLELPRYLVGDRTRLWQILKNYLDNSAKYTKEGSIVLSVKEDKARSNDQSVYISFDVIDTGIGMNEEGLRKAFLPYEQVYNEAQTRYVGTGLGLPISKRLCELMGGILNIESKPGHGTSVKFTIPFTRAENKQTERQVLGSLAGLRILAVDNDEISLEIMGMLLENSGADFKLAHSGEEALDILAGQSKDCPQFDVILLDYLMDGIDGLETARRIQKGVSKSLKLLMVTAYESLLIRDEIAACGISDIIEKPFVPTQFIGKIRAAAGYANTGTEILKQALTTYADTRILICEDNDINQEVAVGLLEQLGIFSVTADNGKQGIELLRAGGPFDLILMDLHMPVMDGFEATRIIRGYPEFSDLPIISLTADAMMEVVDKCFEAGMNDYLSKPIEVSELEKLFIKWLPENKRVTVL